MNKRREGFILGVIFAILFIIAILTILPPLLFYISIPEENINLYSIIVTILITFSMQLGMVIYYVFSLSKSKIEPKEKIKELDIKLKSIEWSKKEIKKSYYNRQISEETLNKLMQKCEEEEIELKIEIKSLKERSK